MSLGEPYLGDPYQGQGLGGYPTQNQPIWITEGTTITPEWVMQQELARRQAQATQQYYEQLQRRQEQERLGYTKQYFILVDPEQEDLNRAYTLVMVHGYAGRYERIKSGLSLEEAKDLRTARMVADKLCPQEDQKKPWMDIEYDMAAMR